MSALCVRGLRNSTGTACHINVIVLAVAHWSPALARVLIGYGRTDQTDALLLHLGRLFACMTGGGEQEEEESSSQAVVVHARQFLRQCQETLRLAPDQLGDTTTTWLKLMHHVRTQSSSVTPIILDATYDGGTVHSQVVAIYRANDGDHNDNDDDDGPTTTNTANGPIPAPIRVGSDTTAPAWRWRSTTLPTRRLPCPVCIPPRATLATSWHDALGWQPLHNYRWPQAAATATSSCRTTEAVLDVVPPSFDMLRHGPHKRTVVESLPNILLLAVDWNAAETLSKIDGDRELPVDVVDNGFERMQIPMRWTPSFDHHDPGADEYQLRGAVLAVHDTNNDSSDDEDEECSTVQRQHAVLLTRVDDDDDTTWHVVNDEDVVRISPAEAQDLLHGHTMEERLPTLQHAQAQLLAYERLHAHPMMDTAAQQVLDALAPHVVDWTNVVGRRLRVQWSRQTWYTGTIQNYQADTGVHTVVYDDGDIKAYHDLRSKTVEWL